MKRLALVDWTILHLVVPGTAAGQIGEGFQVLFVSRFPAVERPQWMRLTVDSMCSLAVLQQAGESVLHAGKETWVARIRH